MYVVTPGCRSTGCSLVLIVATLLLPLTARAEAKDAEKPAAKAQAACLSADYAKGVSILAELYVATQNAIHIFNQGRCYEQNGKYEEAILRFREFKRKWGKAEGETTAAADQHIAECQALLHEQNSAAPAHSATMPPAPTVTPATTPSSVPPAASSLPPGGPSPASTTNNRVELTESAPSQSQPQTSIFGRWWFWTAVGVVVAGGVTAGLLLSRGSNSKPFCPDCVNTVDVNLP